MEGYEDFMDDNDENIGPLNQMQKHVRNMRIIHSIELIFMKLLTQLRDVEVPSIEYNIRGKNWGDFEFRQEDNRLHLKPEGIRRKFINLSSRKRTLRFAIIVKLLQRIKQLLLQDSYKTKRELYYENVMLYGCQYMVDSAIDTITLILKVPRHHLNITASSKGLIAGHLTFRNETGAAVDCRYTASGIAMPMVVEDIEIVESHATMIVVVEKDASFQQFLEEGICMMNDRPCIMITAKGYPDQVCVLATRQFIIMLVNKLNIPVYAITDCDPHGIDIMCMYRFGTRASHFENISFAIPEMRWLGILSSDINEFNLPNEEFTELTQRDRDLALDITRRPYCSEAMRDELQSMLEDNVKLEIQNVTAVGYRYFVDIYLPDKLIRQSWI